LFKTASPIVLILKMNTVADYLTKDLVIVEWDTSLAQTIACMRKKGINGVMALVKQGAETVGTFTERDLITKVNFENLGEMASLKIKDVMTRELTTISADQPYLDAIRIMRQKSIWYMFVVRGNNIAGIVALKDLLTQYQKDAQKSMNQNLAQGSSLRTTFENLPMNIFENLPVGIIIIDEQARIVSWNNFMQKLLGMSRDDFYMKSISSLYSEEEWKKISASNTNLKNTQLLVETVMTKKDSSLINVDITISMLKDKGGNVSGSIMIITDNTERKVAEKKIKESEEKFRTIFDNSPVAITLTDKDEHIILWNSYAKNLLGMNDEDLCNKKVESLYPSEEWKKIRSQNIRQRGIKHRLESKIINKSGKIIEVDISIAVLKDIDGQITGSIGIIRDNTENKEVERALRKNKEEAEAASLAKTNFLANMSHEVRTPMNAIIGMIDLTLDTTLTSEQRDNLIIVKASSDHLMSILNGYIHIN